MNQNYINSVYLHLIKKLDYKPISDENEAIVYSDEFKMLYKDSSGGPVVLNIFDADRITAEQIAQQLASNTEMIKGQNTSFYLFALFVSSAQIESEKLKAISDGQYMDSGNKRFISCITVDLSLRYAQKLFDFPAFTGGIFEVVNEVLAPNYKLLTDDIDIHQLIKKSKKENGRKNYYNIPYITYALLGLNVLIWLLMNLYSATAHVNYNALLLQFGAKYNSLILKGEYFRFLTPVFLHADITHIAMNSFSLFMVGRIAEQLYGKWKFLFVYLLSGITGTIMSFMFSNSMSIGASGAIFGLMGALVYYCLENPRLFKSFFGYNIIIVIIINIFYGFSTTNIDNYGHIGGLIGGFLSSGIVGLRGLSAKYLSRIAFIILTILAITGGLYYGFNNTQNQILLKLDRLEQYNTQKNYAMAENIGNEIISLAPADKNTLLRVYLNVAYSQALQEKYDLAIGTSKKIIEIDPAQGHYMLGLLYYNTKQLSLSKKELSEAKKLGNTNSQIDELLNSMKDIK